MRKPHHALYRWHIKEIALLCGVSLKTAQRWKSGQSVPPKAALAVLLGDLGCFDRAWAGWCIRGNQIVSPENWIATVGDVLSIQLTQAQLSAYRVENRSLRAEIDALEAGLFEEQPLPDQWTIALEG